MKPVYLPTPNCVDVAPERQHLEEIVSPMTWRHSDTLPWMKDGECERTRKREPRKYLPMGSTAAEQFVGLRNLSRHQKRILLLMAEGKPQAVIAGELGIESRLLTEQVRIIRDLLALKTVKDVQIWTTMYRDLLLTTEAANVDARSNGATGR